MLRFVDGYIVLRNGLLGLTNACCCAVSYCGEQAICCGPDEYQDYSNQTKLACRQNFTRQQCDDIGGRWYGSKCGPCIASSDDGPLGCDSLGPLPRNPLP